MLCTCGWDGYFKILTSVDSKELKSAPHPASTACRNCLRKGMVVVVVVVAFSSLARTFWRMLDNLFPGRDYFFI